MNTVFRTDASTNIGTGHFMRCLALAQAMVDKDIKPFFVIREKSPTLEKNLKLEKIKVFHLKTQPGSTKDAIETVKLAQNIKADWIIVDGYHFRAKYQKVIKAAGLKLLFIDDYGHSDGYYADIVLNQNIYANKDLYSKKKLYTKLLLGTKYVLLRKEFQKWKNWKQKIKSNAKNIFITLGGSDQANATLKIIQALQFIKLKNLEVIVAIGSCNPHYKELKLAIKDSNIPIELKKDVTNMPELMAWADLGILGGGTTLWEAAFMGLPSLVLCLAKNQEENTRELARRGIIVSLDRYGNLDSCKLADVITRLILNSHKRKQMCTSGKRLVDDLGPERILTFLKKRNFSL